MACSLFFHNTWTRKHSFFYCLTLNVFQGWKKTKVFAIRTNNAQTTHNAIVKRYSSLLMPFISIDSITYQLELINDSNEMPTNISNARACAQFFALNEAKYAGFDSYKINKTNKIWLVFAFWRKNFFFRWKNHQKPKRITKNRRKIAKKPRKITKACDKPPKTVTKQKS